MAHKYVRTSSAGAANGSNWSNAWSLANLNSNWGSVSAGDTVWLAGGTYTTTLTPLANGSSGNPIVIKRVTANDAVPVAATGWSAGFDAQVIIAPSASSACSWDTTNTGSYITISGNGVTNGIKLKFDSSAAYNEGAVNFTAGGMHDIIVEYADLSGPGTGTYLNPVGFSYEDNATLNFKNTSGIVYNITASHCDIHSACNLMHSGLGGSQHDITIEYSRLFDNWSTSGNHDNICWAKQMTNVIVLNCDISGWHTEGFKLSETPGSKNAYFIGNVWHDQAPGGSPSCFWNYDGDTGALGPWFIYNNTFYGVIIRNGQANDAVFGTGSLSRNNIFWNCNGDTDTPDEDYSFSSGSTPGAHSISNGSNPFVNGAAGDYRIIESIGATYPRNKGVDLGSSYNTDPLGVTRGGDGTWDIGAYEYGTSASPPTITVDSLSVTTMTVG